MGALSRAEGGKNECGSGRSRAFGQKSQNGKREEPFAWHFFFFGKFYPSLVREKNRVWRRFFLRGEQSGKHSFWYLIPFLLDFLLYSGGYVRMGVSVTWFFLKPPLLGIEKGSP